MRTVLLALLAAAAAAGGSIVFVRAAPRAARSRVRWWAPAVAGAAALGATAIGGAEPTGTAATDALLRGGLVALVTLAASRARRGALTVASGLAAAGALAGPGVAVAFAGLGVAVGMDATRRSRVLGAVAGAFVGHALLRLRWPTAEGATAVLAAVATAVVCASAWRRLRRRSRLRWLAMAGAVAAAAVVCSAGLLVAGVRNRVPLAQAVDEAEAGLAHARRGDGPAAAAAFRRSSARLERAAADLQSWWASPARLVPVVAQHARALDALVEAAGELVATGAEVSARADYDRVRPRSGRVDLAAVADLQEPLRETLGAVARTRARLAAARSLWLLPPFEDHLDELEVRAADARVDTANALDLVRVLPSILGAGGQQRWFVAMITPSELRGLGGFLGSWGILTATDGRLELPVVAKGTDLADRRYEISVDPDYDARNVERWGLERFPQNVTSSPHLPSSAAAMAQVAAQAGHGRVDGVLVVDPSGLAGLLRLTGPIRADWWPEPITAENAADVLLVEQYRDALDPDRRDFLEDVARAAFDGLVAGDLPLPSEIGERLAPLVEEKRLRLHAFDPRAQATLARLGLADPLPTPAHDALAVIAAEMTPTKLSAFLHRRITYDVTVDPTTGRTTATVEVRLRHEGPVGLHGPYYGDPAGVMRSATAVYTGLELEWVSIDGGTAGADVSTERGYNVYETIVDLPPGGEAVIRYGLRGVVPAGRRYWLELHRQPTAQPDALVVRVNGRTLHDGPHVGDLVLEDRL